MTLMFCPEAGFNLSTKDCTITRCMYYSAGSCNHSKLSTLEDNSKSRLKKTASSFLTTEDEILSRVENIKLVLVLDAYVNYLLGKSLEDILTTEISLLEKSEQRYLHWSASKAEKPDFARLLSCLHHVLPKL